jgi:hypothetical protein
MACEMLRDETGRVTAIICGTRTRRQRCRFCSTGYVEKLCDFPTAPGKTCDAGMCAKCATSVGIDLDYCPHHKHEQKPAQGNLFAGVECEACEALARAGYNSGTGEVYSRCSEHREMARRDGC